MLLDICSFPSKALCSNGRRFVYVLFIVVIPSHRGCPFKINKKNNNIEKYDHDTLSIMFCEDKMRKDNVSLLYF